MKAIAIVALWIIAICLALPAAQNVQAYQTIQQNGSNAPQRRILNFTNATVVDDPSNGRTNITVATGTSPVLSVFGRTGAVVAASGDYTAAQVTNAVSTTGSYSDPSWIVTLAPSKVGNATAQWNANLLQGFGISTATPTGNQVLAWNSGTSLWTPTTASSGGGSLTVQVGGANVGSQPVLNFKSGAGITQACVNNTGAGSIDCTPSTNYAVNPSITAIQNNAPAYCASSNGTTAATCTLATTGSHAMTAYQKGMVIYLVTDTTMSSTGSLNIDSNGIITVTQKDCSTAIGGQVVANQMTQLWYNGTVFCRLN